MDQGSQQQGQTGDQFTTCAAHGFGHNDGGPQATNVASPQHLANIWANGRLGYCPRRFLATPLRETMFT
jgi:hypothetical protein